MSAAIKDSAKHTPGPWTAQKHTVVCENNVTVAACMDLSDAKLIAAAPEMAEALREMITAFAVYADELDGDETSYGETLRIARAALAKAAP
jgi:hypothetical protein